VAARDRAGVISLAPIRPSVSADHAAAAANHAWAERGPPPKVLKIADGHAWVHGSNTGVPVGQITVVNAPAPTPAAALRSEDDNGGAPPDISVLQVGKRLQMTADVDKEGLTKLKKVLDQYEQILNLLQ